MISRLTMALMLMLLIWSQASLGSPVSEKELNYAEEEDIWISNSSLSSAYCREVADNFSMLLKSQQLPEHLMKEDALKTDQDFNVNRYFTVLDRLSMEPGYVMDYVYYFGGIGGEPVLYARKAGQQAYRDYSEFSRATQTDLPLDEDDYLNHIKIDGTPEGFFQFVLLRILGGQFYLFWHANYDDYVILTNSSDANIHFAGFEDEHGDSSDGSLVNALTEVRKLDFAPAVQMNESSVCVRVVVFTNWGGFIRKSFIIDREFPHQIQKEDSQVLVPYDCGVMF